MRAGGIGAVLGFVIGAIIASVAFLALSSDATAEVKVVEGIATAVNNDGTAIGLAARPGAPGEGYIVAGAVWRVPGGPWNDTFPTCLRPLTSNQWIRLGIVRARPTGTAPGRPVVVWLECVGVVAAR